MNFNNSGNYYGYGGSSERIKTKFIIVTGGVISGLGKGVAGAGIGFFFSSDYKVCPIKLDGYLNTDPGTMNPIEHGEVFVLDDGAEVDMDFGHYERFLDISTKNYQSITMGKIFQEIQQKERRGDFLGKTVQFVPHVTDWIQDRILAVGEKSDADFVLVEVGGTVGDLENELFIEGVRQLERRVGHENIIYVHLTYVPIPFGVNEQKTKPTQQSVDLLHKKGIRPDIIIARCGQMLDNNAKRKIALFANINEEDVFTSPDLDSIYKIPAIFENQKLMERISKRLNVICPSKRKLNIWNSLLNNEKDKKVKIAIVGKYTNLEDSYASVVEALQHCSYNLGVEIEVVWVDTSDDSFKSELNEVQGIIVPGGFGTRGVEGKIKAIKFARENGIPFLGICYGLQLAVIEFLRNECGIKNANTMEVDVNGEDLAITLLDEQKQVTKMGGTMRLGAYEAVLKESKIKYYYEMFNLINDNIVSERHRHRFEVNPKYVEIFKKNGLDVVGFSKERKLVEFIELDEKKHPYFVATQAHPELKSKLDKPAPLFYGLVKAAIEKNMEKIKVKL